MPFQALPIALRGNTGDAVSKLLWVQIVHRAKLKDAPNGRAFLEISPHEAAPFAQCSTEQAIAGWEHLERLGLIGIVSRREPHDEWFLDVNLPLSQIHKDDRKRIKASPDQIDALAARANYTCSGCGAESLADEGWHVDHIIPRSIGGADTEDNLQLLCDTCNTRKGARVHWVDFLGGRR